MTSPGTRHSRRWTWLHRATSVLFLTALVLGREAWFPWFKGSLTGTRLFGVIPFSDPLAALEATLASRSTTQTLLIGLALVFAIYAFLGRAFCAWICPLGLLLEMAHSLRDRVQARLRRKGKRFPDLSIPHEVKYWLLAFFLLLAFLSSLPVFTTLSPINIVAWLLIFRMGPEMIVLGLVLLVDTLAPRGFCRSLCPLGALYSILGRFSPLRILISPETTVRLYCLQCTVHCPMGIDLVEDHILLDKASIEDPECTRCGICVDICPSGRVLGFGLTWPVSRNKGERSTDQDGIETSKLLAESPLDPREKP